MALTDAQWAAEVADIVSRLVDGTITESQAAAELAAATADWPTRTLSNADLAARVSRFLARLNGLILTDGTPDITLGELNTFAYDTTNGVLYGPKTASGWGAGVSLVGPEGQSAKDLVIAAGLLPANATDAQFATWLANAQVAAVQAAVQPMVDDAEGARDAAQAARTGAETAETNAAASAAAAAADANATEADRAAVASDKATVASDRQAAQAAAATATTKAGEASGSADDADAARLASEGARDASAAAQQAAEAARDAAAGHVTTAAGHATAADASADAAAADAVQTAADRTATGADRAAAEAAAGTATDKADEAALSATAAETAKGGAETARDASQAAQAAAEQARDEAQAIAGGDFQPQDATLTALAALNATAGVVVQTGVDTFEKRALGAASATDIPDRAAADARYRLATALLAIGDVDGLAAALAGKATPADITAAISALVDGAPTALNTLKELADALAADDDAIAALTLALDGKQASSATLTALAALTTTAFGRALLEKADAAAVKAALAIAIADVSGLETALAAKADLVGGKVPSAQLPDPPTVPVKASGAELRTATNDDKFLTPKSVADAAALVALTDAATVAVDLAAGTNFVVTLAGNRTLGAPSNAKPGMSGTILIKQDATGSRTLAYNTSWKPFGSTPSLTTTANAVDLLTWIVEDSSKVRFTLAKGGSA